MLLYLLLLDLATSRPPSFEQKVAHSSPVTLRPRLGQLSAHILHVCLKAHRGKHSEKSSLQCKFWVWCGAVWASSLGKRKHTPPCSSPGLFFAKQNGHRRKISVVDMVFLVFIGFLYPPPAWKVFALRPEKFFKRFSFGGGRARFFLLCHLDLHIVPCQHCQFDPFYVVRVQTHSVLVDSGTDKDPEVEGSRSYQSLVTPPFRGTKVPKALVLFCFGAIRGGRIFRHISADFLNPRFPGLLVVFLIDLPR